MLNDKIYDFLKWFLMTFVPAAITLISSLAIIYHFDAEVIILTIGAISTFIAAITGISTVQYKKQLALQEKTTTKKKK